LIIDDGSTDNTREIVAQWIADGTLQIHYHYQDNQGMHGAHNTAYELITTELNTCIDSDDYMPDDAVAAIVQTWKQWGNERVAGIIGCDSDTDGHIIGRWLPMDVATTTLYDVYHKYKAIGDKKLVYRSELTRRYPYPIFAGEKLVSLSYKYAMLDQQYELVILNKILCCVEYRTDGSSKNMLRQYRTNPSGFAFFRKAAMLNPRANFSDKFRQAIHYVSSSLLARNRHFLAESPKRLLTWLALPVGVLLYLFIMVKTRDLRIDVMPRTVGDSK
jgi:glycosyltransferase involved in cell wall biosynthesis